LAKIQIQLLSVDGTMRVSGALKAKAFLQNMVLEDSRLHSNDLDSNPDNSSTSKNENQIRIVRLMEAKENFQKMIEIEYSKETNGDQNVEIYIHSFIVVGSVSYLLEIANFFIPDQQGKKIILRRLYPVHLL
jgi:hypothetical protein